MGFFATFENVSVLFLLILVGFAVGKLKIVTQNGRQELTKLVLYVTMPATIVMALQQEYDVEKMKTTVELIGIMILCYLGIFLISYFLTRRYALEDGQKDVLLVGSMLSNTSFMGYPVVLSLLGEEALFYAVISAGLIFEIVSWTAGTSLIARSGTRKEKGSLRKAIVNPGVISTAIGVAFFLLQFQIPEPFHRTLRILGSATSPMAMLIVGIMLSASDIKQALSNKYLYFTSFAKLLGYPVAILLVLKALGFVGYQLIIPVIMLGMPSAAYVAMFCSQYGNDTELASQLVFVCAFFSLLTIPFLGSLL